MAGKKADEPGPEASAARLACFIAELVQPVLFVPGFGLGQGQEDLAFLPGPAACKVPVNGRFGPFVGQVLAPAAKVRGARTPGSGGGV